MGEFFKLQYFNYTLVLAGIAIALSFCPGGNSISCRRPAIGQTFTGPYGTQCVDLVKQMCTGMKNRRTETWKRGIWVKGNCNSIPTMTAIATFQGPQNTFEKNNFQHAAIFIGCNSSGVEVYDQYVGSNGTKRRPLRYGNARGTEHGGYYYTII